MFKAKSYFFLLLFFYQSILLSEIYDIEKDPYKNAPFQKVLDAATSGDSDAQKKLMDIYFEGKLVPYDKEKALYWGEKSADQGNSSAMNNIACHYENEKKLGKAIYWYKKSADKGLAQAEYNLGRINQLGIGTPINIENAIYWYNLAAKQGYSIAQFYLASLYLNPAYLNPKEAIKWIQKSSAKGFIEAQLRYGELYRDGGYIKKNIKKALYWFKEAYKQGSGIAAINIASIYYEGKEIDINYKKAEYWFVKALNILPNDINSHTILGYLYFNGGYGLKKNFEKAFYHYNKGANFGNWQAQNNLAYMFETGNGVNQNYEEAYYWYLLAASTNKNNFTMNNLGKIQKMLSPNQIQNVQLRVKNFKPINLLQPVKQMNDFSNSINEVGVRKTINGSFIFKIDSLSTDPYRIEAGNKYNFDCNFLLKDPFEKDVLDVSLIFHVIEGNNVLFTSKSYSLKVKNGERTSFSKNNLPSSSKKGAYSIKIILSYGNKIAEKEAGFLII